MPSYALARKEKILKSNYTEVGTFAKISKGVASGFSASNYLKILETFPAPTTSFEAKAKVVTASDTSATDIIYFCEGSWAMQHGDTSDYISFWIYKEGTGFQKVIALTDSSVIQRNTPYWFKVTWDGSVYNLLYSTDDVSYTSLGTYSSTTPLLSSGTVALGVNDSVGKYYYRGSIDLNNSYININGERWWSGTKLTPENRYYVLKRLEETKIYMKYVYQNWVQPVLTSDTSSSKMSLSATSGVISSCNP